MQWDLYFFLIARNGQVPLRAHMPVVTATTLIFGSEFQLDVRQEFLCPIESQLRSILSKTKGVLIQTEKHLGSAYKQAKELNPLDDWVESSET